MTICIAALAEDGARVVLVADQLTTLDFCFGVESPDIPKIHMVDRDAAILTAGNFRESHEIVRIARQTWLTNKAGEFSEVVRQTYRDFRLMKAEQAHLQPIGLTLESFTKHQSDLQPELVGRLSEKMASFDLGVHLIAVNNSDAGCRIALIGNPGILHEMTNVGYACIGEGAGMATYCILDNGHSKKMSIAEVKAIALQSKAKSEKVPSVGPATTVIEFPASPAPAEGTS
ncbi:MAG: hypothetical protein WB973_17895 [Thermoanaerobaculia bacterium]